MKKNAALVIALITFQAMLAALVIGKPEAFGLSPVVVNWMAIISVGVSVLLNQLERFGDYGNARQVETVTTETAVPGRAPTTAVVETVTETLPKSGQ